MPPEERRAQRRSQLLAAGLETFGTHGFHATGVRDICAAANLTERYFYESFKNREALFAAVFDQCVDRLRARMERAMADHAHLEPYEMARAAMRQYLENLRDDPRMVRVLLIDAVAIDADMGRKSVRAIRSFADLVTPILASRFPELSAQGLDVQRIADGLVGSTVFIVTQWALSDFESALEDVLCHCMLFYASIGQATRAETGERFS